VFGGELFTCPVSWLFAIPTVAVLRLSKVMLKEGEAIEHP
jgi:hypothetical protein